MENVDINVRVYRVKSKLTKQTCNRLGILCPRIAINLDGLRGGWEGRGGRGRLKITREGFCV